MERQPKNHYIRNAVRLGAGLAIAATLSGCDSIPFAPKKSTPTVSTETDPFESKDIITSANALFKQYIRPDLLKYGIAPMHPGDELVAIPTEKSISTYLGETSSGIFLNVTGEYDKDGRPVDFRMYAETSATSIPEISSWVSKYRSKEGVINVPPEKFPELAGKALNLPSKTAWGRPYTGNPYRKHEGVSRDGIFTIHGELVTVTVDSGGDIFLRVGGLD